MKVPTRKWAGFRPAALVVLTCFLIPVLPHSVWHVSLWARIGWQGHILRQAGLPTRTARLDEWYGGGPTARQNATDLLRGLDALREPVNAWTNLPLVNRGKGLSRSSPPSNETLAGIRDYLLFNREPLERIKAAMGREHYRFPIELGRGYDTPCPHLAKLRLAALMLSLESIGLAESGDLSGSARVIRQIGTLSQCLADEPLGISYLVRIAIRNFELDAVGRLLAFHPVDETCLDSLQTCVEEENFCPQYRGVLGSELACAMSVCALGPAPFIREIDRLGGGPPLADNWVGRAGSWAFRLSGLRARDELYFLKTIHDWWDATALPLHVRAQAGWEIKADLDAEAFGKKLIVSGMFLRQPARFCTKELALVARSRLAATAFAVERHRGRNGGKLPARLAELAPKELKDIPRNPLEQAPIQFDRTTAGYRLRTTNPARRLAFDEADLKLPYDLVLEVSRPPSGNQVPRSGTE